MENIALWIYMLCLILTIIPKSTSFLMNSKVPSLFIFGDSVLDAGTNNYINAKSPAVANIPPYGETFFHTPTGRFSDGRTIGDFLAEALNLPLIKPYLEPGANHIYGANFASGGAGLLDTTRSDLGVLPFTAQIKQFKQLAKSFKNKFGMYATQKRISESLFLIAIGANDIGFGYLANETVRETVTFSDFITSLMIVYNKSILDLYHYGARKFILSTLEPLGCDPYARFQASLYNLTGCLEPANDLALFFNDALESLQANLTAALPNAKIIYTNGFNISNELVSQGRQYGFKNTKDGCCGGGPFNALILCGQKGSSVCTSPSNHIFWDFVHHTEAAYWFIFRQWWSGNTSYIQPYNIQTLVSLK